MTNFLSYFLSKPNYVEYLKKYLADSYSDKLINGTNYADLEKTAHIEQKKNGYKNKFYKNTAKKNKPSSILIALINNNK